VAKASPRNLKHLASESIDILEHYDKMREKAVYYTQFSWEEVPELVAYLGVDDVFDFYV
jgi:hypothetical protein